jgi:hypothetical protein
MQIPSTVMLHTAILWRKLQDEHPTLRAQLTDDILKGAQPIKHAVTQLALEAVQATTPCQVGPVRS